MTIAENNVASEKIQKHAVAIWNSCGAPKNIYISTHLNILSTNTVKICIYVGKWEAATSGAYQFSRELRAKKFISST